MNTASECVCCKEVSEIVEKMDEFDPDMSCITSHPGFTSVCLDVWVLQTAYYQLRQEFGEGEVPPFLNE